MHFADNFNHVGRSAKTEMRVAESKGTPTAGRMRWPRKTAYMPTPGSSPSQLAHSAVPLKKRVALTDRESSTRDSVRNRRQRRQLRLVDVPGRVGSECPLPVQQLLVASGRESRSRGVPVVCESLPATICTKLRGDGVQIHRLSNPLSTSIYRRGQIRASIGRKCCSCAIVLISQQQREALRSCAQICRVLRSNPARFVVVDIVGPARWTPTHWKARLVSTPALSGDLPSVTLSFDDVGRRRPVPAPTGSSQEHRLRGGAVCQSLCKVCSSSLVTTFDCPL